MAAGAPTVAVEIRVELKPGIVDAEADNTLRSLGLLGISGVTSVGVARLFTLTFRGLSEPESMRRAQQAVDRLLANPVIHRVTLRSRTS